MMIPLFRVAVTALICVYGRESPATIESFSLESYAITESKARTLQIHVHPPQSDLTELTIESIVQIDGGKKVVSDLAVRADDGIFIAELDKLLDVGMYKVTIASSDFTSTLPFKVLASVAIQRAVINGQELSFGESMDHVSLSSGSSTDKLHMEISLENKLTLSPVWASQAVLRLFHEEKKISTYFMATAISSDGKHVFDVHMAGISSVLQYNSGEYSVEILLGSPLFEKSFAWNLGTVEILLGVRPPTPASPIYSKSLLHESDTTLKPLKELEHTMRKDVKRPHIIFPLIFSAIILLPLLGFFGYVSRLQLNIDNLFKHEIFPFAIVFVATLASMFCIFGWFWISLTMYQTLSYLSFTGAILFYFGVQTMKRLEKLEKTL